MGKPKGSAVSGGNTRQADHYLNRFVIQVATVNGSGSQSSNVVLMRSIFGMGVPVGGKNLFPSNIQGLPTWFTIRVNRDGHIGQCCEVDVLVCMNAKTAIQDVKKLSPGKWCIYDAALKLDSVRSDIHFVPVPFAELATQIPGTLAKIRKLLMNMCYVGVLAELLGVSIQSIEASLNKQFKQKQDAVEINLQAIQLGIDYARQHVKTDCPFRLKPMDATEGKLIMDGNSACALGAVMAGCSVLAWYPITPSSSFCESFIRMAKESRHDKVTGKATYAVIQAEDELASIGMVLSANFCGARAMTATSGPGISLMSEFAGMGYYAEIPAVILNVQRAGPSTGLPTRTQQADIMQLAFLSHGDTKQLVVFPGTVEECYSLMMSAFDLAERFQSPVFVATDLDLAMNNWMVDALDYPVAPLARGNVLTARDLKKMEAAGQVYERYGDPDGDGIPYRTLPGNAHPASAYLVRGSGHSSQAAYTEDPDKYVEVLNRIDKKFETARAGLPEPEIMGSIDAEVGVIAFGSSHIPMLEALDILKGSAKAMPVAYLRIRAFPFHENIKTFVEGHARVYVLEQNRDAQMLQLLKGDLPAHLVERLQSLLHYNGMPLDALSIVRGLLKLEC